MPDTPPREAVDYFRAKDLRVGFDYRDVWGEEHAASFTVAKAMQLDILDDIRSAIDDAIANGTTFQQFKKTLQPTLEAKGWWGRKDAIDPLTGETRDVQLGSPRRLKTIYDANLRAARSAGAWQRGQRTKATHPYGLYELGPAKEHRAQHVSWAGTLLPLDHEWWRTHSPPNDYGCHCRVRFVSRAEAARLVRDGTPDPSAPQEINPTTGLPTGRRELRLIPVRTTPPPVDPVKWINKRTGEEQIVDRGLNPAWANNAGMDRISVVRERLAQKIESTDQHFARAAVDMVVQSEVLDAWMAKPEGELAIAVLDRDIQRALDAKTQVVRLSVATLDKQSASHAELTADHYRLLPDLVHMGIAIQQASNKVALFRQIDGRWHKAVVKLTEGGKLYLVSYHQAGARELRREMKRGKVLRSVER